MDTQTAQERLGACSRQQDRGSAEGTEGSGAASQRFLKPRQRKLRVLMKALEVAEGFDLGRKPGGLL
jgi:hypothetical protein